MHFRQKLGYPPRTKPHAVFLLIKIFKKIKKKPPYEPLGHDPLPYLGPRASQKKTAQHFVQIFEKKVKFRRFEKKENRRKSVTGAKMHIFEKFKKGALGAPH